MLVAALDLVLQVFDGAVDVADAARFGEARGFGGFEGLFELWGRVSDG